MILYPLNEEDSYFKLNSFVPKIFNSKNSSKFTINGNPLEGITYNTPQELECLELFDYNPNITDVHFNCVEFEYLPNKFFSPTFLLTQERLVKGVKNSILCAIHIPETSLRRNVIIGKEIPAEVPESLKKSLESLYFDFQYINDFLTIRGIELLIYNYSGSSSNTEVFFDKIVPLGKLH